MDKRKSINKVSAKIVEVKKSNFPKLIQKGMERQSTEADPYYGMYESNGLLVPPYPVAELLRMTEYSTILEQCIEAYKRNITGFGAKPQYTVDQEETEEMKREWDLLENFIKNFSFEQSFEDVWGDAIVDRERCGNGYIEIIRDGKGDPVGGYNLDPEFIRLTNLGQERVSITHIVDGVPMTRRRRFRKYAQVLPSGKIIWFKEFGDPRFMNAKTGEYTITNNGENEATEIIHLKIGRKPYGIPRWIGQLIHMYGARKAEELNYNYFYQGRHNPAAIIVSNGMLTQESIDKLIEYSESIQGTDNAYKFLIIEAEGIENGIIPGDEKPQSVKVELKSLADMLQNDALFLEYDRESRSKVQSAFRLPDIYVGKSKDFNRATADTARSITEEQVFEPERNSLEFVINNILLRSYGLKYTQIQFEKPEIGNVEDLTAILDSAQAIGGITPNDVRDLVGKALGKELEPYDDPRGNLPLQFTQGQNSASIENPQTSNESNDTSENPLNETDQDENSDIMKRMIHILKDIRDEVEDHESGKTSTHR